MGAQLEVATGYESTAISITAPAERMPATLDLLARIMLDARFPEREVQRVRTEQLGEIEQRRADPRALASDEAVRFIYGSEATYGRPALGHQSTVERLTAGDVRSFYHDFYSPRRGALILAGALDDDTRRAALEQLGAWQSEPAQVSPSAGFAVADGATVHIVDRPGSVQSEIRIGHPGPPRNDPDYFPLQVMNSILGGAFTSRLNMNLREKQGFTYGVRSSFTFRRGPGPFLIATAVASDVTARAIEETLLEVDALRAQGPTAEEINNTRDYLSGILPLELQTTSQVATKLSEIFVYSLPDDFFRTYRDNIAAVTRADAQRVAERHIQRDKLTYVVVGDATQIAEPLRELGLGPVLVHGADA
jgi:zinc protease